MQTDALIHGRSGPPSDTLTLKPGSRGSLLKIVLRVAMILLWVNLSGLIPASGAMPIASACPS